jgi:dTDP-4-dehydrorhamnose 3,5-epimerase-like enzyme
VAVRERVRVGANSTVVAGVTIAPEAVVRPGSVVTRSVPPRAIVEGNPATIIGYVETESVGSSHGGPAVSATQGVESTQVRGVTLHRLPLIPDLRGNLTVGEFARDIPFVPQRYFMVFSVPNREVRGEHAHRECHQFLICVRGSCSVVADDGERRVEVLLDAPEKGLYLPPMTWGIQYRYSNDAVLLVFASHHYDAADYIRDYAEYLAATAARD